MRFVRFTGEGFVRIESIAYGSVLTVDDSASMCQMVVHTLKSAGYEATEASDEEKKKQGKTAGATGWLVKPFNSENLLATVKESIELIR